MGTVYQKDKRSGLTYAYDSQRVWSKEKQKYVTRRKLLGRVDDMETKEIIPTDGRGKRRSPYLTDEEKTRLNAEKNQEFRTSLFQKRAAPEGEPESSFQSHDKPGDAQLQELNTKMDQLLHTVGQIHEEIRLLRMEIQENRSTGSSTAEK